MKNFLAAALLSTTAIVGMAGAATAAGTAAETNIANTISLSYETPSGTQTFPNAASVTFMVDRKVDVAFDGLDALYAVNAEPGQSPAILSWMLINQGNDTQGFDIDVLDSGWSGLTYDPTGAGTLGTWTMKIGTVAGEDAGDVLYNPNGIVNLGDLPPDAERYVKIYAYIPTGASNGDAKTFLVSATALEEGTNTVQAAGGTGDIATLDTIFADEGLNDAPNNGTERATETLTINAPDLTASKTMSVIDENLGGSFNCAVTASGSGGAAVPGACIEYTITVNNSASAGAAATNVTITDAMPAGVTYAGILDATNISVSESGGTVTGTISSLATDSTASFKIRATVD